MFNDDVDVNEGKQADYEKRRNERVIGLACYGSLIDLQNFLTYTEVYSWPEGSREIVDKMRETVAACYKAMKDVEVALLGISDVFYAPIIPTENKHKQ